jgi:WD40 repeat protein
MPKLLRVLNHLIENGRVRSVAWSPDGNSISSGSDDATIKVWNTKTGQCVSLPPNWESAQDTNGKIFFYNRTLDVVQWDPPDIAQDNAQDTASVRERKRNEREPSETLRGHSRYVTAVSYSFLFSNVWCVLTIEHFTA